MRRAPPVGPAGVVVSPGTGVCPEKESASVTVLPDRVTVLVAASQATVLPISSPMARTGR